MYMSMAVICICLRQIYVHIYGSHMYMSMAVICAYLRQSCTYHMYVSYVHVYGIAMVYWLLFRFQTYTHVIWKWKAWHSGDNLHAKIVVITFCFVSNTLFERITNTTFAWTRNRRSCWEILSCKYGCLQAHHYIATGLAPRQHRSHLKKTHTCKKLWLYHWHTS